MNFSQEIINVLDYLCKKFGIAVDWTSDNVMPYLQDLCTRYVKYETLTSIANIIMFLTITIMITILLAIVHKKANELDYKPDCFTSFIAVILWVAFAIMIITSMATTYENIFNIIECHTLPEKVIFEYLKTLT